MLRLLLVFLCALSAIATAAPVDDEQRLALVIGNGQYASSPLTNPVNDARAMGRALQRPGFKVTLLENASLKQMLDATRAFGDGLSRRPRRSGYGRWVR